MRFFFFVSLSRLLRTPFAEKREKREKRDERGERDFISPVRDVSEEKQKRIFSKNILIKGANASIDFLLFLIATSSFFFWSFWSKKKVTENQMFSLDSLKEFVCFM